MDASPQAPLSFVVDMPRCPLAFKSIYNPVQGGSYLTGYSQGLLEINAIYTITAMSVLVRIPTFDCNHFLFPAVW